MRCEANVSLRLAGSQALGAKVEVKNLNSFRSVRLALEHEIERQARVLDAGGRVRQVTMGWDERGGRTVEQRVKEESEDYRYFPDPDLPPLAISRAWVDAIRAALPELPDARQSRFMADHGLSAADAALLAEDRDIAGYYEAAAAAGRARGVEPADIAHWLTGEVFRRLKGQESGITSLTIAPETLAELVAMVGEGTITASSGKAVLDEMLASGRRPAEIVAARNLAQISEAGALGEIVDQVLAAHPALVAEYRAGKESLLRWFVGEVIKTSHGKASPQAATRLLQERLARQ
jgi:aspartyl-tRNA(Asn)/glutamyl-tRNA(Gln) amidotransferase subunit B